MIDASLINLPWATLVTLASGYIGYFIANVGLKDHHKPIDVTFSTLIFGLFAAMVYQAFIWVGCGEYFAAFPAVVYAFANGAWWRKYGRKWMYKFLRDHDISWSDSTSSAWQQMFGHTDYRVTEVYIILKDGSGLLSRLPGNYEGLPNGPFTLGDKGDVVLYVTHRSPANSDEWEKYNNAVDSPWGALASWVPADQIARIDIRRVCANHSVD
ncbi:hypothetical protein CE665_20050 [Salmonella enterica subsp. enterica serovar Poona]|nr:hypothetical protein [Salmonella enterica subsp. diarizonae]EDJ2556638.1 hypothetical protein [Salmonella enterica subsp. enterica serovar Poona]EKN5801608.1 hypothetical protein [Salmonella enterica subsp. enterica]